MWLSASCGWAEGLVVPGHRRRVVAWVLSSGAQGHTRGRSACHGPTLRPWDGGSRTLPRQATGPSNCAVLETTWPRCRSVSRSPVFHCCHFTELPPGPLFLARADRAANCVAAKRSSRWDKRHLANKVAHSHVAQYLTERTCSQLARSCGLHSNISWRQQSLCSGRSRCTSSWRRR